MGAIGDRLRWAVSVFIFRFDAVARFDGARWSVLAAALSTVALDRALDAGLAAAGGLTPADRSGLAEFLVYFAVFPLLLAGLCAVHGKRARIAAGLDVYFWLSLIATGLIYAVFNQFALLGLMGDATVADDAVDVGLLVGALLALALLGYLVFVAVTAVRAAVAIPRWRILIAFALAVLLSEAVLGVAEAMSGGPL